MTIHDRAGQIAAADDRVVNRQLGFFDQFACADGYRLVGAGDGAHTFREDADGAACLQNS